MNNFATKVISTIAIVFALAILLGFLELVFPPVSFVLSTLFEIAMSIVCVGAIAFMIWFYRQNTKK